ncbi:MAG: hybrid sensor histidine kinase/response regulator [Anaerolineae bacterium]|nr:hybrid sensor histidine kinase/response regulator [Anaerolineae bacterium]
MTQRILVVDDDERVLRAFARNLQMAGYVVLTARGGEEALAICERECPSIVLIDMNMPHMGGLALLEAIRARMPEAAVILITGYNSGEEAEAAERAGAADVLVKPIDRETLESALQRVHEKLRWQAGGGEATALRASAAEQVEQAIAARSMALPLVSKLASGIVHEMNQPLATILLEAEYLKRLVERARKMGAGELSPEALALWQDVYKVGQDLIDEIAVSRQTMNQLRTFSRLTRWKVTQVDLDRVVRQSLEQAAGALAEQGVAVSMQLCDGLPAVLGEPRLLQEVMAYLVDNAGCAVGEMARRVAAGEVARATYRKQIHVATDVEAGDAVVRVQDNGCGISDSDRSHIFRPFFTTHLREGAVGVSLFIAHTIVEAYGGQLTFESAENKGTIFTLRLPALK